MIKRKHYLYLSETEHNTLIRRLVQMKNKLTQQGCFTDCVDDPLMSVIAIANQKGGVGNSTTVYNLGVGLVMQGKKVLLVDINPRGDLTKMLGLRKLNDLPLTLGNAMNNIVAGIRGNEHPEIRRSFVIHPFWRSVSISLLAVL